jgi:hypothetical protein
MVAEAEDCTYRWLDRVEASIEKAHAALLGPDRCGVPEFTMEMESAFRERSSLAATPAMASRLGALRERLRLLQFMLRQAAAFIEAREQETESVLGYTPRGLERAL